MQIVCIIEMYYQFILSAFISVCVWGGACGAGGGGGTQMCKCDFSTQNESGKAHRLQT